MNTILAKLKHIIIICQRRGVFGRKARIKYYFRNYVNVEWDETKIDKECAQKFYHSICNQYKEIRLHVIGDSNRVGEYICRYLMAVEDTEKNKKEDILDVFYLRDYINHNSRLTQIMGRHINIVDKKNADEWGYTLVHFPKVVVKYFWDYQLRNRTRDLDPINTYKYLALTKEEENEVESKKRAMKLRDPYVCISNRDSAYLRITQPGADCSYHDFRDSNISSFSLAADYLAGKHILTIRMGRYCNELIAFGNCIDYANKYYDELMDIALMRDCKFYCGDPSGINLLPMTLNTICAFKDLVLISAPAYRYCPQNPNNIFIFKKYYSRTQGRFLSIKEMLEIEDFIITQGYDGRKYQDLNIELINNTEEEIRDLIIEINDRIDGVWIETEEDKELQRKYQDIFDKYCLKKRYAESEVLKARVGAMFLRKNPYLLENIEI